MGKNLPKNFNPIQFGSWMGGERWKSKCNLLYYQRSNFIITMEAAKLYEKELTKLIRSFSMGNVLKKF